MMTPGPGIARTPLPKGFTASGVNCGVRRYRPDLGLILSDRPAVGAGVFTENRFAAAPVHYCRSILPSSSIRAVVTNSGQANAATGPEGVENNKNFAFEVAKELECFPREVLVASTGVIGPQLDMPKIIGAIPELVERTTDTAENFSLAILTTDLVPKTVTTELQLSGGSVRITGICKGSGMIHPNMATMLGYLLTDAIIPVAKAQALLKDATDVSFNMISVDGDSSTNDAVFFLANGAAGVGLATHDDEMKFQGALREIAILLAQSIAIDGEGATKLVEIRVKGAPDLATARRAARGVTVSPLVKTAMHGEDPNWGRIIARLGAEQVPEVALSRLTLTMQGVLLFGEGRPQPFDKADVKQLLKKSKVLVEIDLRSGSDDATAWGCDLSKKYVDINTEYTT
jgi:glutamate N-acetyltransferase / amino-acid N-acetyltransferase